MEKYFSKEELCNIFSDKRVCNYKKTTLDNKINDLFEYFISKKIELNDIKRMILDYPRILTLSIELIKDRYDNLENIFDKKLNKLLVVNSRLLARSIEEINSRIDYFIDKGLTMEEIIKVCLKSSKVLNISTLNLDTTINKLKEKINDDKKILEMISKVPRILLYSVDTIDDKFNWFLKKGYSDEQTVKIICKTNTILTKEFFTKDGIESDMDVKFKYLYECFGYSKEQIIYITYLFPEYFTLSMDTIKNRINNLYKLGFDDNVVRFLFYNFPQIISLKESCINEKYNYYFQLNLLEIFVKKPKCLIQSLELTDARYRYLISKGILVNEDNYSKLFISSNNFKKVYGIDNDELLKKYKEKEGYYEQGTNKRDTIKYRKRIKQYK